MPRHNTYRPRSGVETVGAEWSSGQLSIGIAVAIIFGMVCFFMGYVVANVDRPLEGVVAVTTVERPAAKPAAPSAVAPARPEATPRSGAGNRSNPPATTTPSKPSSPSRAADAGSVAGLHKAPIEPLPEPGKPTPMTRSVVNINAIPEPEAETETAPAIAEKSANPDAPPPIIPPSSTPVAEIEPISPVASNTDVPPPVAVEETPIAATEPPASAPPAAQPEPPAASPVAKPPTVTRGSYGIQVAAFNGPRREEQAQQSRKKLKAATGLDAEIVTSPDGVYEKVVVTGFSTEAAARDACKDLKAKEDYAKAWVVRLP